MNKKPTMKALVLTAFNHFEMQDWPVPEVGPEEVLLKVAACGICGSDVHGMDGSSGRRKPPIIMGHEAAGVIERLGRDVTGWAIGDRVTFDSIISCGKCWFCRQGLSNLCDLRRVPGVSCDEFSCQGAFAEFVAVPQRILCPVPEGVSMHHAAMVEPVAIAMHAVSRAKIRLGDTAVVVGAGIIGLLLVQTLRAAGCGRIIAVDLDQKRLDLAGQLGADLALKSDASDVHAETMRLTRGRGADVTFEVVGIGPTVQLAADCLRKGGQLVLVGILAATVELPVQSIVTRELSLIGSYCSSGEYPACLDLMMRGAIDVAPLLSAVAPLSEGPQWFQRLHSGKEPIMKVILEP
jgi:L-iditol 2-dehydrogenase